MDRTEFLTAYLAEHDESCPGCGYSLRDLTSSVCPECGRRLALRVQLVDPKLGAFIFGLIGIGGGLGFSVLLIGYFLWMIAQRSLGPDATDIIPLGVTAVVLGIALAAWLLFRRTISGWFWWARWGLACIWWIMAATGAMWFFVIVD